MDKSFSLLSDDASWFRRFNSHQRASTPAHSDRRFTGVCSRQGPAGRRILHDLRHVYNVSYNTPGWLSMTRLRFTLAQRMGRDEQERGLRRDSGSSRDDPATGSWIRRLHAAITLIMFRTISISRL
jgi:hypothetical protein